MSVDYRYQQGAPKNLPTRPQPAQGAPKDIPKPPAPQGPPKKG